MGLDILSDSWSLKTISRVAILFAAGWIPLLAISQELPEEEPDFQSRWESLSAAEDIADQERVVEYTAFLHEAAGSLGWTDSRIWEWAQFTLDLWGTSSEINLARKEYTGILLAIGASLQDQEAAFGEEARLREYYDRALSLELDRVEQGTLLLFLAESWLRSANGQPTALHRAESLLQQASDDLGRQLPMDVVHMHLGELALSGERLLKGSEYEHEESPNFSQAAYHFRAIQRIQGARDKYLDKASRELKNLLQPQLECSANNHFLPQNDIRISVRTRNILFLEAELVPLPTSEEQRLMNMQGLRARWLEQVPGAEEPVVHKRFPVRTRTPVDWTETVLSLGDDLVGGWYGLSISGGGQECREIILVTSMEIVVIPRVSGDLAVWVSDSETGLPRPGSIIHVLDEAGIPLTVQKTGPDGSALLQANLVTGWSEIHVSSQLNPGIIQREPISEHEPRLPWVIPGNLMAEPGQSFEFCVFGYETGKDPDADPGPTVLLPNGDVVVPTIHTCGESWMIANVLVPELPDDGPVYLQYPGGQQVLLAHMGSPARLPLEVEFVGDRLLDKTNLFFNSSSPEVRLNASAPVWDSLPDYMRIRITRLERAGHTLDLSAISNGSESVLLERILSINEAQTSSSLFSIGSIPEGENRFVVKVEVMSLDGNERLGIGYAAVINYRRLVRLETSERIVRSGDSVRVNVEYEDTSTVLTRLQDGDLVLYRETWESRYMHRKKGNLITESEYSLLPDRSLLGAAKTDFRIIEQGFVREEIRRMPVKASVNRSTVSIPLERPGYYRIAFESPDPGTAPVYKDGSLEVWALPESGDLHAFRTSEPRSVVESREDGAYESLILIDRNNTSVLMDFEHEDGTSFTYILQPSSPAVAYDYIPETSSPLKNCRFFVVGDRRTDFLWWKRRNRQDLGWELGAERLLGVSPGAQFSWPLSLAGRDPETPVFWTYFQDLDAPLIRCRMDWQTAMRQEIFTREPAPAMLLEKALPLFHPLATVTLPSGTVSQAGEPGILPFADLIALYPELRYTMSRSEVQEIQIHDPESGAGEELIGFSPATVGRWHLFLFSQSASHDLGMEDWLLSTELPILSNLGGPETLRLGDQAALRLQVENTIRTPVDLTIRTRSMGVPGNVNDGIEAVAIPGDAIYEIFYQIEANALGNGKLVATTEGSGTTTEAVHEWNIYREAPARAWTFMLVPPQEGTWSERIALNEWSAGTFLVAPGLGSLLPELWPVVRRAQAGEESLLVALGDWALARMVQHQGLGVETDLSEAEAILLEILSDGQNPDGGWAWTSGQPSDPWLSALVFWALGSFGKGGADAFTPIRESARIYLEKALINDHLDLEHRLFALRALSAENHTSSDARLTRIQARSFLEFLYQRSSLSRGELAILLEVARAFAFREEILLLETELRLAQPASPEDFYSESLIFQALHGEGSDEEDSLLGGLEHVLASLSESGPARSWEHVAGFLNLMRAYHWRGEFNVDGSVSISINGGVSDELMLNPDPGQSGLLRRDLDEGLLNGMDIEVDTAFALSPVVLVFTGIEKALPDIPPFADYTLQLFRDYEERTLFSGTHKRSVALEEEADGLYIGDILRLRLSLMIDTAWPNAEFCFPVPAGLVMETEAIEFHWEALSTEAVDSVAEPVLSRSFTTRGPCCDLRMQDLPPGRLVFDVPFRAKWTGTFAWPDNTLLDPKTGKQYAIPNVGPVSIKRPER